MTRSHHKIVMFILSGLLLMSSLAIAQSVQTADAKPPIAQPLVREGDFAVKLASALKLGTPANETEAESLLGSAGIEPRNGWIADYPVTPDIIGELQTAIASAANAGKLAMEKDAALNAAKEAASGSGLSIKTDESVPPGSTPPAANYPESPVINNYYYDEGPPVVTYYSPPPDYAYMYTWVPYPFWGWSFWYPGYFVLVDFHVRVHGHGDRDVFVSNHFRDRTGGITRIDPANRANGGTLPLRGSPGLSSPSARSGAQAILRSSQGRISTGASRVYRGYGDRPATGGTRPSVFERSRNSRFDRAASERGFQSRSYAGRIPVLNGGRGGRATPAPGGSVSSRGERSGPGGDGGGYHGGGGRR